MKSKLIIALLGAFVFALMLNFASPVLLTLQNATAIPSQTNITHGSTVQFNLIANYTSNSTDDPLSLLVSFSGSPNNAINWTFPAPFVLNQNQTSTITASIFVPSQTSPQAFTASVSFGNSTISAVSNTISYQINVPTSKSLAISSPSIPYTSNSALITITNTGNTALSNLNLSSSGDFRVVFNQSSFASIEKGASVNVLANMTDKTDLLGTRTARINASAENGAVSVLGTITYLGEYCEYGNYGAYGKLKVSVDLDNINGFGDENDWYPGDEIEAKITVENVESKKVKDIEVEWGLYNVKTGSWYKEDKEKSFKLEDKGDEKTLTISFKLNKNIDEFEDGDMVFYARATGRIGEDLYDGYKVCASDSETDINIVTDESFVILDNIKYVNTVPCGVELEITADVLNTESSEQNNIYAIISNSELGINKKISIGDISGLDNKNLNAVVSIPSNAKEKTYSIKLSVYNEDDELFESGDGKNAEFSVPLTVAGSCAVSGNATTIVSAVLESGGKAGKELVVKATITNTGASTTFIVSASGYSDWASLLEISPEASYIESGKSKDVLVKLKANKGISGEKTFSIVLKPANSNDAFTKPVSVEITSGWLSGTWYLWAIGALNVVLIILIIAVAIRAVRN